MYCVPTENARSSKAGCVLQISSVLVRLLIFFKHQNFNWACCGMEPLTVNSRLCPCEQNCAILMQHVCSADTGHFIAMACCHITLLLSLEKETMQIYVFLELFISVVFSCLVIFSTKLFQIISRTGEVNYNHDRKCCCLWGMFLRTTKARDMFYCTTLKKSVESEVLLLLSPDSPHSSPSWCEEAGCQF